ncbi:hypothetical protein CW354_12525 [Marinicaulis flavus]|jgi:hypothetical protein|uniref:Uncharacterized protein n=1 Tax=Hyphococcus luteus TaxID=2058213 RepID=A0A2S7K431_9PROT|nr:hypothetical protein CW354_12525 [Marinicaulis flavus]
MNRKILTLAAWVGLIGMLMWTGMSSSVFESRLLNFSYEIGASILAIALVLFFFFAATKLFPNSRGLSSIAILVLCILVGVFAKFLLDNQMHAKAPTLKQSSHTGSQVAI